MTTSLNLDKLNSHVFISEPPKTLDDNVQGDVISPSVVILFSWMDGARSHVEKYATSYRTLFPKSTIVLVTVKSSYYWMSENTKESIIKPVLGILRRELEDNNDCKGVLLHAMSNGGGWQLMTLRKMLLKDPILSNCDDCRVALVMDSTPGDNGLESAILANASPNFLLRLITIPLVALAYSVFYLINTISGNRPLFEELRDTFLQRNILPIRINGGQEVDFNIPRLYIYSKTDRITLAKNVERHVKQASSLGLDVKADIYEKSPHVAHARTDPERYWNAIREIWHRAVLRPPSA